MIQYPLPNGSKAPWAIAGDSVGRIWVVEQVSNQIAMFNPVSATYNEYNIPTPNSTANSIAVDGSGNVWFTELTANRLGELANGSSKITEYRIPNSTIPVSGLPQNLSCGPIGVIPGPLESIWVLCLFSNQIDEFFPENATFDSFDLPIFQSGPAGLVFDHNGNFWFTAADINEIGHGILSELRANTSDGITETPPLNSTYVFDFQHTTDFKGDTQDIKSSLPTPSGIALSPDGNTLWITEHVDSSFDSYNIATKSLNRYWTSQTNGAFGYSVSFPNGIAIDSAGNVWIAEHYGNKVAEYSPSTGALNEYVVPCCKSSSAGVYTLTLGKNGTVWFVEILGDAIGELEPISQQSQSYSIKLSSNQVSVTEKPNAMVSLPLSLDYVSNSKDNATVSLEISGISSTGALSGASAQFKPPSVVVSGSGTAIDNLTISVESLKPGAYYLTISAEPSQGNVIYSSVLKLVVVGSTSQYSQLVSYGAIIGVVVSILVVVSLSVLRRKQAKRMRRRRR
jgi:streptogramin lyase